MSAIHTPPTLFVVSDNTHNAALVEELLGDEFGEVLACVNPDNAAKEFDRLRPDVLMLAFNSLEKSEHYYLGLFRLSECIHQQAHRTIILCSKDEVRRAYTVCREGLFDDYVLFWPLPQDASRLFMVVHHALREVLALKAGGPTAAEFAAQARRLVELEALLVQQIAQGGQHIEETKRAITRAELDVGSTLDEFSKWFSRAGFPAAVSPQNAGELVNEIRRLKRNKIQRGFRAAAKSVRPLMQWANEFKQECEPHLESIRAMNTMADRVRPLVLVVDDDEFQRKIISNLLQAENYRVVCASGGIEGLNFLRKESPDLILIDFMMPDMNGLDVVHKVKGMPKYADIPIIMITGKSEKTVVTKCMKAGVTDFVVKPFDREKLVSKVSKVVSG